MPFLKETLIVVLICVGIPAVFANMAASVAGAIFSMLLMMAGNDRWRMFLKARFHDFRLTLTEKDRSHAWADFGQRHPWMAGLMWGGAMAAAVNIVLALVQGLYRLRMHGLPF